MGWLFPGRNALEPISTRQLNRAVHEAAETAGIRKRVSQPTAPPDHRPPCPCCGGRMIVIEILRGAAQPRAPPVPRACSGMMAS